MAPDTPDPVAGSSGDPVPPPAPASGFPASVEEAEREAERVAAMARAAAGIILAGSLGAAITIVSDLDPATLRPRLVTALSVMSGFVILAAVSFMASRARRYRPGLAYLFVAGDALLVLVALQGGMRISGHPGQMVFAEPGAWLIPIAIAIQAVRFRTGPLVFAAAVFVLEIVGLTLFGGGGGGGRPGPAAEFGPVFSVPADIIRALMLAIAAAVLVVSVRSKREILVRGLGTARREAELRRFLPDAVVRRLAAAPRAEALAGQRVLAILFIDLIGFTRAGEHVAPGDVAGWLAGFRERMNGLVGENGGFVDKFIGDAVMAIFGYECAPEVAADQALRVIAALPRAMDEWRAGDPTAPALEVVAGGALGAVIVGVIGSGARREFTVIGDAVNVAARLEGFAKEKGALAALSFQLVDLAGRGADHPGEDVAIRGHREPVRACLIARRPPLSSP